MMQRMVLGWVGSIALVAMSTVPAQANLPPVDAAGLDLGPDAGYAVIDLGSGTTFGWNSGPVNGNVLVGNGVKVSLSGGNNGGVGAGDAIFTDGTAIISGSLQNQPAIDTVTTAYTANALAIAQNVSTFASGLTPTQTFSSLSNGTATIFGGAANGLNVINVGSIQNETLTLSGNANDYFIINVSGSIQTNRTMTLSGVLASHILWNLTATSGNIFVTSGGDTLYGTFLATDGGSYQFSNLVLTGELINTAGNIQLVSGSQIPTGIPFSTVPEPSPLILLTIMLLGGMVWHRKRIAKKQALAEANS